METDLETLLNRLKQRIDGGVDRIPAPFIYLDPGSVTYLYQQITGLGQPPRVVVSPGGFAGQGATSLTFDQSHGAVSLTFNQGQGVSLPPEALYSGLLPFIHQKVPLVEKVDDLVPLAYCLARFQGIMQSTRFPDGNLNLEIQFAGIRGLLFYTKIHFSSMFQPLLDHDRFHRLSCHVDALAYLQGPVQKNIFYHQTYGDNMEYLWVPIVPMALIGLSENREGGAE